MKTQSAATQFIIKNGKFIYFAQSNLTYEQKCNLNVATVQDYCGTLIATRFISFSRRVMEIHDSEV